MSSNAEALLDRSNDLPDSVVLLLREIKEKVQAALDALDQEAKQRDNRNDVDALIEFDKLPWNFNNIEVHNFRSRASRYIYIILFYFI